MAIRTPLEYWCRLSALPNFSLSLRGAIPKNRDVAISPKLVSRRETGDHDGHAVNDIVTNALPTVSGLERFPRQASRDAFLGMTSFWLWRFCIRNPVSGERIATSQVGGPAPRNDTRLCILHRFRGAAASTSCQLHFIVSLRGRSPWQSGLFHETGAGCLACPTSACHCEERFPRIATWQSLQTGEWRQRIGDNIVHSDPKLAPGFHRAPQFRRDSHVRRLGTPSSE